MFQTVMTTLIQVIVPLSIPVIAGALLKRFKDLDTKPLLTLYLYFLSPAIILETLTTAEISFDDIYKTLAFCVLNLVLMWAVANGLGRLAQTAIPGTGGSYFDFDLNEQRQLRSSARSARFRQARAG
ncbi:hypothetical protein LJK87_02860 [Paenibacillus sp. P25]|nr:hypothetical protein LJK87_02860 [Paenibacillus sp. P25]